MNKRYCIHCGAKQISYKAWNLYCIPREVNGVIIKYHEFDLKE